MNVTPNSGGFDPYNPFAVPERPSSHPMVTPAPGTTHADAEVRSQGRVNRDFDDIFSGGVDVPARTAPQVQRGDYAPPAIFAPPSATSGREIEQAKSRAEVERLSFPLTQQVRDQRSGLGAGLDATAQKDLVRGSARDLGEDFDPRTKRAPDGTQAGMLRPQKKAVISKPGSTIVARGKIRRKPRLSAKPADGGVVTSRFVDPKPKKEN